MTTFQVTLYLCMLGLCLTAPKTRNVRWCVTSDIEDKKCNDLVHSCSIQEILLICVKRSSTQDCMKAISDGNADAISMDSGDVYKASLNPYNLKPIMIESYGSHKAVSVVDTPCLKERQKLLGGERPRPGAYIPQCDEKGDYKPQQCHGSTGYCWCVNSKGEEIPGTKTPPGQTPPTCGVPVVDTPCLKERQKVLGGGRPLLGAYVPQCDEKGDYTPQQCHGSTGYCWCVSSKGEEIAGTKTPPGQTPPTCGVPVADSPCLKERQKLLGGEQPRPGAYIPQCDEKGDYRPQQCHGSTGYCWCVNAKGEEIPGTKTPPGQTPSTCGVPVVDTPCFKERQKVLGGERPRPGAYIPQCDEKGDYSPQQCHSSTGYCWCVNSKGEEIAGTKTPPGQTPSTCKVSAVSVVDTPCLKERQQKLGELPVVGAYVPQCDEKGDYSPQQCHGSTGYCWCVNAKGEEIAGTKTPPGQTPPTCGVPVVDTPCLKERQKALGGGRPLRGAYVPQCDEKGDYSPQQCHGSTGYCWCVSSKGEEIAGTKTPPGQTPSKCGVPVVDTPCFKERQKLGELPGVGAYVPQCDEKGDYSPQQCHGSTGYCWCVNAKGEEIAGTKTPPGQTPPTCGVPVVDTPCLKERQKALGGGQPLRGAYVPQCDEKGDYSPQQCHGSTGYCWCVNAKGEEIPGTKTPPGQTPSTCGVTVVDTPCLKERQKVLGGERPRPGAYIPQCDEKGDYSPQQCHSSTGYCWCVNSKGEEIAGTKTPPGQTPSTCKVSVVDTPCFKERQKLGELPGVGAYVPQCDEKGDYSPQQCHGSTGYCWCVNAKGEEIAGTKTPPGQTPPTCGVPVVDTPCLKERQKALGGGRPLRGAYVPQCDEKGDYSPQQCHGSTGYCWCVSSKGEEIAGTKTPPGQTPSKCGVPVVDTPCFKERQKLGELPGVGAYVPQCDEKGDYSPQQCHGSTGYCWCVNAKGEEIAGTKTPPGQTPPTCGVPVVDTPCLKERQKALGGGQPLRGAYVPQCDEKGDYSPQQCHGSTGYCWCVNAKGEEIPGTKTPPGQTPSTCGVPVVDTPCLKERQKALRGGQPLRGAYVPQCDEKGDYSPQQCHGSTGYCWCVNAKGEEIAGTKTPPGQTPPTCGVPVVDTPCLKERQKVLGGGRPLRGAYVPQCDEKGDYTPQQCHGSTGYCWCVSSKGEEIAGTKTPPGQTPSKCGVPVADSPCLKERQKLLGGEQPRPGAYIPQCDEKGDYRPQQCHGSTGYCWCVNAKGEEIPGTKTPPGQTPSKCGVPVVDTPCFKERQKLGELPGVGAYVPQCDEKGDYSPQQCHGSTGYCWCVNAKGEEIAGTKTPPGQTPPTCGVPVVDTPCLKERQKALGGGQPLRGAYVPQCDEKGDYSPQQCHGSTGYCWCVNAKGEEIPGTKTPPGQTPSTCGVPVVDTPCLKERQKALGGGRPLLGAYVPQCDEKGDYSPLQHHGSTGYCWCVNAKGEEIPGTKTPPGQTPPTCGVPVADASCLKERQKLLGEEQPRPGAYIPQCDEKGDYIPKQCHGSTGYCWCVNSKGEEIAGTKTPPGQTPPKCAVPVVDTPCLKERQKALGGGRPLRGAYVPQCDEKGDYSPLQHHGSTGYSWCVNAKGEEIAGTKTPPGQTPPTCGVPVADASCLKERQKLLGEEQPRPGAYIPQCDEKGDYIPKQCHGSTGYCWCVNSKGEEIAGTKTPPGQTPPKCAVPVVDTPCLKERQKALGGGRPLLGAYVPQCDEKGDYSPLQHHGSTGYSWCVNAKGEEIAGTKTPPGQTPPTCGVPDSDTCHYAVAVVKKSSRFQFNELKGKRSCHSEIGTMAGWNAPVKVLLKKKLLLWEGPEKESIEKAVSGFFSVSCIPGAIQANLCRQCTGEGNKKCKSSHDEPYYGNDGAFTCLRADKGDVAFVKDTALSGEYVENYELLCPDNTRRPLREYKDCNLGKVPADAVLTRRTGDKTKDINKFLLEAQKKECKLFSSKYGKDLLFEDSATSLIPLPSEMDTFLLLGAEWFNVMKELTVGKTHLTPKNNVRWCTQSRAEKMKCDNWSSVSGGAISCTEASSADKCVEQILKGEADAVTLDVEHMYTALKCGLVPALEEYHNKDDFNPCKTHGSEIKDFGTYSGVALVKKSNKDITWKNLKGKKSCHTDVGHIISWNMPVSLISKQTNNCDIGSFFNQSCAPGSDINSNLCKLCIGDPKNIKANTKCSLSDQEAYYGNAGAFRCLVEKGDVAFLSHTVVYQNTDGKNPAVWAKNLKSNDFELLCLDGSRASVTDYKKCNLANIPPRAIVTRQDSVTDVVRIVNNQQSLYGRKGFEKDMFQMFASPKDQNLLFSDDTQCLIQFDRLLEDILLDYFGKSYNTGIFSPNQCSAKSELLSACTFHHC